LDDTVGLHLIDSGDGMLDVHDAREWLAKAFNQRLESVP
jgi:hypothetical protein